MKKKTYEIMMKKERTNKKKRGPSGVGIFISVTFPPMCPLSKNEWSLKEKQNGKFLFE